MTKADRIVGTMFIIENLKGLPPYLYAHVLAKLSDRNPEFLQRESAHYGVLRIWTVDEDYRKLGIGQKLFEKSYEFLKKKGKTYAIGWGAAEGRGYDVYTKISHATELSRIPNAYTDNIDAVFLEFPISQ